MRCRGLKEADLFPPVARLFENLGYRVSGEVKGADLAAVLEGRLIMAELKTAFSLKLVYQAMERRRTADAVYCVIPRPKTQRGKAYGNMLELLSGLEIGLITVAPGIGYAEIVLEPGENTKRRKNRKRAVAENEIDGRAKNSQIGGVTREKILTAYRERALELLCIMEKKGEITFKELSAMGFDKKAKDMLYRNFYGWFERKARGTYSISKAGEAALADGKFSEAIDFYRERAGKINYQEEKE